MTEILKTLVGLVLISYCVEATTKWSYRGESGPEHWPKLFQSCGGEQQSSASLDRSKAIKTNFENFVFVNYDFLPSKTTLYNNGRAVVLHMKHPSKVPSIVRGGGLSGEYVFLQSVFHWGQTSDEGSEHHKDQKKYPMELQMVHYKREYNGIQEAMQHHDGLAIFSVLFEISLLDNPVLNQLSEALWKVTKHGQHHEFYSSSSLLDLLPKDRTSYFRYNGSLTTPLCEEVVVWTVFAHPVVISERQLNMFRKLKNENGEPIGNNFRPVQALNNRKLYYNSPQKRYTLHCIIPLVCPLIGKMAGAFGYL